MGASLEKGKEASGCKTALRVSGALLESSEYRRSVGLQPQTQQHGLALKHRRPQAALELAADEPQANSVVSTFDWSANSITHPKGVRDALYHHGLDLKRVGEDQSCWYLPHPQLAHWVDEFLFEASAFPRGKFDDWVDCWSQAVGVLTGVPDYSAYNRPVDVYAGLPYRRYGW